jgi:alpha-galactosidase
VKRARRKPGERRERRISCAVRITTLASGLGGAKRIAVDATHVYWNDDVDGAIMKVPIAGGAPTILASGQMGANGLAVGATQVYWTDSVALTVMSVAR